MNNGQDLIDLENSLMELHHSVSKMIQVLHESAETLDHSEEILDVLPLLDFYNDDLLLNIQLMRDSKS